MSTYITRVSCISGVRPIYLCITNALFVIVLVVVIVMLVV